jgi:hypothetical protein
MGLTFSKAQGVGHVRGTPIFRIPPAGQPGPADPDGDPPAPLHMALGKEVILLGSPIDLVKDAIERFSTGAASLADDPGFREAQAARRGSLHFAYAESARLWEALREDADPGALPVLAALEGILGVERIGPIHTSLSRTATSDALRLDLRVRPAGAAAPAWKALATPPLDASLLGAVPAECLAFAATRWDHGPERWRSIRSALDPLLDALPPGDGAKAREALMRTDRFLSEGAGRTFLEEIDAIGAGMAPASGPPFESAFLVLRFREAGRGEKVLEDALTALLGRIFDNRASRAFAPEPAASGGPAVRSIEPAPGIKVRHLRIGDLFVVSAGEAALRACAEAAAGGARAEEERVPPDASKVLLIRPAALLAAAGSRASHEARILLGQIERALISTREGDGLSVEIQVPGVTRTVRATLERVAGELRKAR